MANQPQVFHPRTYSGGWFSNLLNRWQWTRGTFFNRGIATMYGTDKPKIEIDCDNSFIAYNDCPHLRAMIDKKAEMFSNGEWKCVSVDDEETEFPDDEGLKLLNNPNPLQSREDFLFQASYNKNLFSNNFITKISGSTLVLPKAMWHLPSDEMSIVIKSIRGIYDQYELDGIIEKYLLDLGNGEYKPYTTKEIIFKAENFSFKEGKGLSRIPSLKYPINNLMASLKTRNIMTVNFGVKGFISPEGKDVVGPVTIKTNEREMIEKQVEDDYNLYSNKSKIKIVNVPTKFSQMSANMKDMLLLESEEADFKTICAVFGMKKDIFPFVSGATFENQIQAEKSTYQSTIIPEADSFAGLMTKALNPKAGRKYILSYDWLPILKEDEQKEAETEKIETERRQILFRNGLISPESWAQMEDVDFSGDGQIKANQPAQINVG